MMAADDDDDDAKKNYLMRLDLTGTEAPLLVVHT